MSLDLQDTIDESRLRRMRDVLTHRGPDGDGLWVGDGVGLAHRRLAIVDVAGGLQPMTNEDGSVWMTFNGEIYNHADLRPGLEAAGHRYKTRSDSETIIHLYEEHGDRCVEHLRGMFAFAIWDRRQRRVLLARDRVGIKPLYYAVTDRELLFGSEIKSILASGAVKAEFNQAALPEFLATRFVSGEETFFNGVRKLLPGHTLTWSPETGFKQRRYWQIPAPKPEAARDFETEAADLKERLLAAVKRHLMSDVPLGVFLSGGIDSSALAAMTAGMVAKDEKLQTFSVGFAEQDANELPYARAVASHIGSEHREVLVSPAQYFDALPKLIWQEDEPIAFTSSVPLYFVSKLASDHVKVVLTGEGADELFLGYNRYRVTLWNNRLGWPYWTLMPKSGRAAVRRALTRMPSRVRRYASRMFLGLEPGIRSSFLENFAAFPEHLRRDVLADAGHDRDPYRTMLECFAEAQGGLLDRLSRTDIRTYMHELLMKQDQMSMAASIESRVPFLDDSIIEHVAALPGRLKLRGWTTKAVMRAAVADYIPKAILTRKKMGFPVPVGGWLRGSHAPIVNEFVLGERARQRRFFDAAGIDRLVAEHRHGTRDHGDRLWLLVNLEIWLRIFIDGEDAADVMRSVSRGANVYHANSLGQDGRPVAADLGRAPA